MDDYGKIIEKERILKSKENLLDDTIVKDKLSKHEIISKMYEGLVNEIEELKGILFKDLAVTNESKEKAEKISKIAFALQSCLDMENGNELSENLNWLYRYIRYMSKRIQDNECMNFVQPAFKIASDLKEAWESIPEKHRN
jgi:flagellin-specific chaperone FliS|tara:strand:+ start:96 stop:518 length:423 start_codon:yes stop_codon:yes gene_type:complete